RIILEARQRGALHEVLVIAAALSLQDVRDRPLDLQAQADQQHAKFDDEKSEFSGYLRLWQWLDEARGGHGTHSRALRGSPPDAAPVVGAEGPHHRLSNRQYEQLLRQNFINVRRVREWRDVHSQLLTVVTEHKWRMNEQPASYEQLHKAMLSGLLGNIGFKLEDDEAYLGARGIKFYRHPGAHLKKRPGRWVVCAELVETTRLFGRGMANIEPQWVEEVAGHLLKKQLLDPHWEKKAAEVVALERATLYGLVIYSGRRVPFARVDLQGAREIFIREGLVAGEWETRLPFLAANQKLVLQVEELEHKSRRQDVLVDEELIYAFYDQQLPKDVYSGTTFESWYREASRGRPDLLKLTRDELMRHEAAGITSSAFPKTVKLGGVDCAASYLHEPGDPRDGLTVSLPLFVLNQVNEDRVEWLVPGMLKDKVQALLKSLPQKPRSRFVPLPESAARIAGLLTAPERFGHGGLTDVLLKLVRDETSLDVKRTDFKLDMVPQHLFMNIRVIDEHGRQLGTGRNLGALKAELGAKARGAFQALAGLKVSAAPAPSEQGQGGNAAAGPSAASASAAAGVSPKQGGATAAEHRYTAWTFGELPELMEIRKGGTSLVGFPALIDQKDAVSIEVFDEPEVAAARHRAGLRRLFALQLRDALKYLEKNIPDLQKMAVAYLPLGTQEELRDQIVEVALDRAFLMDPLPATAADFQRRLDEGRGRLTLIANEVARLAATILGDYAAAARKIKETRIQPEATADAAQQLQRLVPRRFLAATPWARLQQLPRYLKAIVLRLDKLRADPARDATRTAELKPQEQRYWRLVAERKGAVDDRMEDFRWLLEELRVSFFAQELRTPQPVSLKRLEKLWGQINS
ncbi:MAG: DUF3418 domain-containing protein, partial [Burkholderiales bacterium]